LNSRNYRSTLEELRTDWEYAYGNRPFNYFFLDDYYEEQYKAEVKFGSIFGWFSGLAILVACLGLFGLASFMTRLRTKEVSVRKVLGASFQSLWVLLTGDFLKLVGIAILISLPLTWWLMSTWLQSFANRIPLSAWLFFGPACLLIAIAVGTVSYHTLYTANVNPASTLKDE
ncbi:MAG: FtsX-like permease family protein, partial [Bacteroidota bacterium]